MPALRRPNSMTSTSSEGLQVSSLRHLTLETPFIHEKTTLPGIGSSSFKLRPTRDKPGLRDSPTTSQCIRPSSGQIPVLILRWHALSNREIPRLRIPIATTAMYKIRSLVHQLGISFYFSRNQRAATRNRRRISRSSKAMSMHAQT